MAVILLILQPTNHWSGIQYISKLKSCRKAILLCDSCNLFIYSSTWASYYPYQVELLLVNLCPSEFLPAVVSHTCPLGLSAELSALLGHCRELGIQGTPTYFTGTNLE